MNNKPNEAIELINNLINRFEFMTNIYLIDKKLSDFFVFDLNELKKMLEEK